MFKKFEGIKHSFKEEDNIRSCDTLSNQYRLPSKISEMISSIFYDREFKQKIADPKDFILEPIEFKNRQLIWVNTGIGRENRERREGINIFNISEAKLIRQLLSKLKFNLKYSPFSIAILSPYKEQVEVIKKYLPKTLPNLRGIDLHRSCYTVDSFQGQEADLIIVSLARNNNFENSRRAWGFIPRIERLNVMLSRAKKVEIIIGSHDLCILHQSDPYMEKFVKVAKFIEENDLLINQNEVIS
ncbi:MAG: AAA domain-containing protein [Promethearchaeota archaeon]